MPNIKIGGKEFDADTVQKMFDAGLLSLGQKNDPASLTLGGSALHGPLQGNSSQFGLFSAPGVRPQRFSALARPNSFFRILNLRRSEYHNEIIEIVTGQTASAGTNATGFCGNPPTVGHLKTCAQTYTWGDYYVKTDLNAIALIGQRKNRADVPGQILNAGPRMNPIIPDLMYALDDTQSQLRYELYRIGVDMERTSEQVGIQGVAGTQNSTFIGWTTQFRGLDGLIRTGHTDSLAAGAPTCPAADSAVIAFNALITGTDSNGLDFVEALTSLYRGIKSRASQVGMGETVHVLVMHEWLFSIATEIWACNYSTVACDGTAAAPNNRDGEAIQRRRIEMYNGKFLWINGEPVPVVFSEGIPNPPTANNIYNSDIYIVPVEWMGTPLINLEYFPMDNQYAMEYAGAVTPNKVKTLNNGLYLMGYRDTGLCMEYHFQARMRMILETPFLAGRLDDVRYTFTDPTRQAIPGASAYVDGGVTMRL